MKPRSEAVSGTEEMTKHGAHRTVEGERRVLGEGSAPDPSHTLPRQGRQDPNGRPPSFRCDDLRATHGHPVECAAQADGGLFHRPRPLPRMGALGVLRAVVAGGGPGVRRDGRDRGGMGGPGRGGEERPLWTRGGGQGGGQPATTRGCWWQPWTGWWWRAPLARERRTPRSNTCAWTRPTTPMRCAKS